MAGKIATESRSAHGPVDTAVDRRTFLVAGGLGFCGLHLPSLLPSAQAAAPPRATADSTILVWLCGGASHIDTWDMKPDAPVEYRGEFKSIQTSAPEIRLCEHLPLVSQQAHHLAIVRSLGHFNRGTNDHHAGYYYNLTGRRPDPTFPRLLNNRTPQSTDAPFMGSVVGWKRPLHPYLPQVITLPKVPGAPLFVRPGQFAATLGVQHDPYYIHGNLERPMEFSVPSLGLEGDVTPGRLQSRRELLKALDAAQRAFDRSAQAANFTMHQERAFSMLGSPQAKDAFDLGQEPESVRERYGQTVNGMSLLMARRLVEARVPFVSVFWMENPAWADECKSAGGWDTHANNFNCLREHLLPEFDRAFSALLEDLDQRGLLPRTLVMVNSEMGRAPRIGDPRSGGDAGTGRDHWTHAMSVLLAGGGIRGGQVYGSSDRLAAYPDDLPVAPEHIAKTVYRAMGVDDLTVTDISGRPVSLLDEGTPITALF